MSQLPSLSRRRLLKAVSGAPLLPLAGYAGAAGLLSGCGGSDGTSPATITSVSFTGMSAPATAVPLSASEAAAMATVTVGSKLVATYSDGSKQTFDLKYQPFFISGDMVPNGAGGTVLSGGYYDIHNQPIIDNTVPAQARQFFSDSPDGTSLLSLPHPTVAGIKG